MRQLKIGTKASLETRLLMRERHLGKRHPDAVKEAIGRSNKGKRHGVPTHGLSGTRTYQCWQSMLQRCTNPKGAAWEYYGGRGIKVCAEWVFFENFYADMGECPDGLTLDRIDVDGNYEPGNCRWATRSEQLLNRRPNKGR